MTINLKLSNLQQAVKYIQKAIPNNPQLPILSSIYFHLHNSQLTLAATDLYLGIKTTVPVQSEKDIKLVIPGETFRDLVNSFSVEQLEIDLKDNQALVKTGQSRVKIPIQKTDDYPEFPELEGQSFSIPAQVLEEIKQYVSFAASTDQARPVLTAIMLKFSQHGLEVVGTDGFRLSLLQYPELKSEEEKKLLIPVKAFNEVCRIAGQTQAEEIVIQVADELKQVKFEINNCQVFVRLIEGDYPPYEKIIPDGFKTELKLNGEQLRQELQRAFILAKKASNIVKLQLKKTGLQINSSSPAHGEYQGKILLKAKNKQENEIAFNTTYLLDFLASTKPEVVHFAMNESLKPAKFTIEGVDNFLYVVMPFRVNQ